MGPEELDSLLQEIRAEGKKERSALTLYQGTRGTDLVNEYVDERIVNILGLGQVFDIDYSTYLTLLKEKLVQVSMGGGSLARDEQMLLQDEFKRVKGKVGRFKINRRTASVGAIAGSKPLNVSKDKFFLTSSAVIPESPGIKRVSEDLEGIGDALDKLIAEIRADNKEEKRQAELDRREKIRNRRSSREKLLEKSQKKTSVLVNKLFTPVKGILDKILKFLIFGLLSTEFTKFIGWFSDPKNKEKVASLFRFLKDFWPAILGGLALFFTPFGGFVRGLFSIITRFTPKILSLIGKNKLIGALLAGGGLAATLAGATTLAPAIGGIQQALTPSLDSEAVAGETQLGDTQSFGGITGVPISGDIFGFTDGGQVINTQSFAFGGPIDNSTGIKITGAGPDTQLIAAQPGEFVVSKKAVDAYGPQFFMQLNKDGGGTNIPKFIEGIQLARGGGMVGKLSGSSSGMFGIGGLQGSSSGMFGIGGLQGSSTVESISKSAMAPRPRTMMQSSAKPSMNYSPSLMKMPDVTSKGTYHGNTGNTTSGSTSGSPTSMTYKSSSVSIASKNTQYLPEPPVRRMKPSITSLPEIVGGEQAAEVAPPNSDIDIFSPSQSNSNRQVSLAIYGINGIA